MSNSLKCYGVYFYSPATGRLVASACKRRGCERCGPNYWLPRKRDEFLSGLIETDEKYHLVTVTAPRLPRSEERLAWNRGGIQKSWNRLRASLGRTEKFEFWRVAEMQKRGAVHYHVVTRGLTASHRRIKELARSAGFGHVDVQAFDVGAPLVAWAYLSKTALSLLVPGVRRYSPIAKSRGWALADPPERRREASGSEPWLPVRCESSRLGVRLVVRASSGQEVVLGDGTRLLEEVQALGAATTRLEDQEKIKRVLAESPCKGHPNTADPQDRSGSGHEEHPETSGRARLGERVRIPSFGCSAVP